jgi:hypothetical protein
VAAGEELAAEADVETGPAHDVGHEGIAGDETAARQSDCEGTDVETVARTTRSFREVALEDCPETSLARARDGVALVRKPEAAGELAQQLGQRQVRACGRLESMRLRFRDADGDRARRPP